MWQNFLKNIKAILVIAAVAILLLFLNQCNITRKLKDKLDTQEQREKQNMAALNDSITVYKNKSGYTTYGKPIADMSAKDIEKYFPDLYKKLKDELGEVQIIWKTKFVYIDTGSVKNAIIKLDSNKYSLNFDYYSKDSSLHVKSKSTFFADPVLVDKNLNKYSIVTKPGITTIQDVSLKLGFTTGIKKENNLYKIFITPDNKNVIVTQIEGADVTNMINPPPPPSKYKKWSVGPYIGFGITFSKGTYQIGPGAGVSIQYSLLRF